MKSAKALLFGIGLLVAGSVSASTNFYLHADMVANDTPNDKALWWTDPVGGTTQESLAAPTSGNRFDMNGFLFRSQNTAGSATFNGTAVVNDTVGSATDPGFLLYTGTWNAFGMDIENHLVVRPHQASTAMVLQELNVGAHGELIFRTLTGNNNVALSAANISGSGLIQFGTGGYANDTNAVWTFSVLDDTPEFSGAVALNRGQLVFGNDFALTNATLAISALDDYSVVLSNSVSFGAVMCGAALPVGTYTAAELNAELSTDRFSGPGTLTAALGPAPTTYYLHASIAVHESVLDKDLWFDDPVGGTSMAALGGVFQGNRFDVNGFEWRAPEDHMTSVFGGTIVVEDVDAGLCLQYAADWHLGGLDIGKSATIRPHLTEVSMSVGNLALGPSGNLSFRTLSTGNNIQNLSVANIEGSGTIQFGIEYDNDVNAVWSFSLSDSTPEFTGSLKLFRGQLTFGSAFDLDEATFTVDSAEVNAIVLSNDVSFAGMTYGAVSLSSGTYTAAELNADLGTDRFSGPATLMVGAASPSQRYSLWTDAYPSLGSSTNLVDDPDSDGMDNLLEYALGGDPTVSDAAGILPGSGLDAGWMYYIYSRRLDAADRGLDYSVVSGTDLVYGSLTNATEEVGSATVDAEFETVTNRMPVDVETQAFMKLNVEITE